MTLKKQSKHCSWMCICLLKWLFGYIFGKHKISGNRFRNTNIIKTEIKKLIVIFPWKYIFRIAKHWEISNNCMRYAMAIYTWSLDRRRDGRLIMNRISQWPRRNFTSRSNIHNAFILKLHICLIEYIKYKWG